MTEPVLSWDQFWTWEPCEVHRRKPEDDAPHRTWAMCLDSGVVPKIAYQYDETGVAKYRDRILCGCMKSAEDHQAIKQLRESRS